MGAIGALCGFTLGIISLLIFISLPVFVIGIEKQLFLTLPLLFFGVGLALAAK